AFIPADAMQRWLGGSGFKAVGKAALFGAPLPLCSCGVLPAAISMKRSGASKEATVSFLISTPETSIDSVAVTYALMGPVMAVYRPVAAVFTAMVTGWMTSFIKDDVVSGRTESTSCCSSGGCDSGKAAETSCCLDSNPESKPRGRLFHAIQYAGAELLDDIAKWLFLGIVIAGVIATIVPPGWLAQWGGGLVAMLVMLVVGVPMYICAVASTPIAAGLLLAGVSPGTVLVFLLVGPATNFAGIILIKQEMGLKVTCVYLLGIAVISVLMGLLLDYLLLTQNWQVQAVLGEEHRLLPEWLVWAAAVLLLILAIRPLRRRLMPFLK
ncbi:MAG: SO_0444 family Cu/Zn efflux transporter, partial [Gammaproteobacteria bacterium]|nr:SO_0444 family Cu/Zn efflux transporter [Gammaproteobacteria bacterium]